MGIINYFRRRCTFCKTSEGTQFISSFGMYESTYPGDWYHDECLREIVCEPEKYPSITVDLAVDIIDRIEIKQKREKERIEKLKRNYEYLKQHCV